MGITVKVSLQSSEGRWRVRATHAQRVGDIGKKDKCEWKCSQWHHTRKEAKKAEKSIVDEIEAPKRGSKRTSDASDTNSSRSKSIKRPYLGQGSGGKSRRSKETAEKEVRAEERSDFAKACAKHAGNMAGKVPSTTCVAC